MSGVAYLSIARTREFLNTLVVTAPLTGRHCAALNLVLDKSRGTATLHKPMGYALDLTGVSRSAPPKPRQVVLDRLAKVHESILPMLAEFIISPDGVNAGTILPAALSEDDGRMDRTITLAVTSNYRFESLRTLFCVSFSASGAPRMVRGADDFRPICKGCLGQGFQTPMRNGPLFKKQVNAENTIIWTEYSKQERQALLESLRGPDLDARVPPTLRNTLTAISSKLDELRGKGALDDAAKSMGEAQTDLGWDDVALSIHAHISQRDELLAVAPLYTLTPCGRTIDCGEGPKLYSSDWEFTQAFSGRPKEPDIDYFRPCWWCRGRGANEKQPWKLLCEATFISKLFGALLKHRIEKGRWTTSSFEADI